MKRIKSVMMGRDPEVLDQLFEFYVRPAGKVVDVTCNKRRMWKGLNTEGVIFCDIDESVKPDVVCDFRKLPFGDKEVSVIVFDPPHLPSAAGTDQSLKHFVSNYGLKNTLVGDNVTGFFKPFLEEAKRVLVDDGLVFCKLADFVHNHRYQWSLVDFICAVRETQGLTATDLILKRDPSAGNLASGRWVKSFHARRCHCYFIIIRKGKCEPKTLYPSDPVGRKI